MEITKRFWTIFFLIALIVLTGGCAGDSDDNEVEVYSASSSVIVYGRDTCSLTTSLKSQLDAEGIDYTYKNIDESDAYSEMWEKVQAASWYTAGSSVGLPIVDANGTVLERPSVDDIKALL